MKNKWLEILGVIGVCYMLINLTNSGVAILNGYEKISAMNHFTMLFWTSIGVIIIYTHQLFTDVAPLKLIIIQYVIGISIIMMHIYIDGRFNQLHPNAYRDGFRSFTIPFIIGSIVYYLNVYYESKKQNEILKEIQSEH